jgi:acyl-CoA reductase-like NAD-dependent aldehyde dehydrogenase
VALGLVAAIMPWNFPVSLLFVKLAPALLAGDTVVAKPAPTTPLTTCLIGEIFAEVLPPGVLNIICDDNDLGDALTSHPDVANVSFTGSTTTGKKVMASGAATLKRLTLELGGNDPAIVLDDVDPAEAAARVFAAAMMNSGQVCLAAKRVYVPRSIYDEFCDELAALASGSVVGDGLDPATTIGPIQNRAQFEKAKGYLAEAHSRGRVIAGGAPVERPGYFIAPTIVRDIADDSRLVTEEQFSPILPVLSYDDIDDAIARANATPYGLGATVWGRDTERASQVAMGINSGTVWVNQHLAIDFRVTNRGAKESGIGGAFGQEGFRAYTQSLVVNASAW